MGWGPGVVAHVCIGARQQITLVAWVTEAVLRSLNIIVGLRVKVNKVHMNGNLKVRLP